MTYFFQNYQQQLKNSTQRGQSILQFELLLKNNNIDTPTKSLPHSKVTKFFLRVASGQIL